MKIIQSKSEQTAEEQDENKFYENWHSELEYFTGNAPGSINGFSAEIDEVTLLIKKIGELILSEESIAKQKRKHAKKHIEDETEYEGIFEETSRSLSFRKHTYKSLFLLAHSILENRIVEFSLLLYRYGGNETIRLPKLDKDFKHYIEFLENRLANFNLQSLFPDFDDYSKVRNVLAHRKGFLTEKEFNDLGSWIEEKPGITVKEISEKAASETHVIEITHSSFIIEYLSHIKNLLNKLVAAA